MADHFWGRIEIGGCLHRQHLPELLKALGADDESDLPRYTEDGHVVRDDPEARGGRFEELEDTCRDLGLPYVRQSDGKYEFSPEIVWWQPGMDGPDAVITDHGGCPMVPMEEISEALDLLRAGNAAEALGRLEYAVTEPPTVPPFAITD